MGHTATFLFFIIFSMAFFLAGISRGGEQADLVFGVPACGHVGSKDSVAYTVPVDGSVSSIQFALNWRSDPDHEINLSILDPKGKRAEPSCRLKKTVKYYSLENPEAGNWTATIEPGNKSAIGMDYCIIAAAEHNGQSTSTDVYPAKLNGLYRDSATEGIDGLIDYIALAVGVTVLSPGNYSAEAILNDTHSGKDISLRSASDLNIGMKFLYFYLFNISSPGPYKIEKLRLYDGLGRMIDTSNARYTTKAYDQKKIRQRSAELSGYYSDHGVDTNSDGLFDLLTLDVGIDVAQPGEYSLMGMLYDSNGAQAAWSISHANLSPGSHIMHMDFDGKAINLHKFNGTYTLHQLVLSKGDSSGGMVQKDAAIDKYVTGNYSYVQFVDPVLPEKIISGAGSGELLLTIAIRSVLPVFDGRYNLDLMGVNMPPFASNWSVGGSKAGYAYDLPGIHIPRKPNNFSVRASGVKNLNVGVKQISVPQLPRNIVRSWVSKQASASRDGSAIIESDLVSPGRYQFKVFGDAADNATEVSLVMKVVKKLIINGDFKLALNMSGFPEGSYSIDAKALNGSFRLDDICLDDL